MSSYIKSTTIESTVFLTFEGVPVSGVLPANVNVSIKKSGQTSFQPFVTTYSNWIDLGGGYYTLIFSTADTDTAGNFVYKATGAGFDDLVFNQFNLVDPALAGATQSFFQDSPCERTIYLEKAGVPTVGLLPASVSCRVKKSGSAVFDTYALSSGNWKGLGNGYYTIKFDATSMSNVGNFMYTLSAVEFDNFAYDEFVIIPKADVTVNNRCILTGSVLNLGGNQAQLVKVSARMVAFPASYSGNLLSGDIVYTYLDSDGKFSLSLLRGVTCIIEIPRAGIRSQINVPNKDTAKLVDLLPPFVNDYTI